MASKEERKNRGMMRFLGSFRHTLSARALVLAIVVAIPIGIGVFTFGYAKGTSYLSDDPAACVNCHVMREQYDAWRHGSHANVATCNDCHIAHDFPMKYITKGINGFNHSVAFTLGNFADPIRIKPMNSDILQHNCESCHQSFVDTVIHVSEDPVQCVRCHADVGHNTRD